MRRALLLLFLAAAALAAVFAHTIAAQVRAVGVVATTMELPVLAGGARVLTGEPRVEEIDLAGSPATLYRPAGDDGPWPALLFVNGATARGREEPAVRRLAEGLARTGHLVAVPDLPGLRSLIVTLGAVDATVAAAEELTARSDAAHGRVALVGVSIGGTLALLAASDARLRERVTVVAAIAPFTDLREVLRLATTGHHRVGQRLVQYDTDPFVHEVAVDSLATVAALPFLPPAIAALLHNDDPRRFDELYEELPGAIREALERLSPVRRADRLTMRVEVVSDPDDPFFPPEQTELLVDRAPSARLTRTRVFGHADAALSLGEVGDAARFNAFVVRTLEAARR